MNPPRDLPVRVKRLVGVGSLVWAVVVCVCVGGGGGGCPVSLARGFPLVSMWACGGWVGLGVFVKRSGGGGGGGGGGHVMLGLGWGQGQLGCSQIGFKIYLRRGEGSWSWLRAGAGGGGGGGGGRGVAELGPKHLQWVIHIVCQVSETEDVFVAIVAPKGGRGEGQLPQGQH